MENNDILYLRLVNKDQITGRYVQDTDNTVLIEYPMLIENKDFEHGSAINLIRYLPFTGEKEQVLILKKEHIIVMNPVTVEFAKYFYNSVHYYLQYVQPQTEINMKHINTNLEIFLSNNNQKFMEALSKYQRRIPNIGSHNLH